MKKRKSVEQVAWNVCVEGTFYLDYNIFRVIFSYIFGPLKDIVPGRKQVNLIVLVEKCSLLQVSDDISFFFFKDVMDDISLKWTIILSFIVSIIIMNNKLQF